jgi:hypothetical protein
VSLEEMAGRRPALKKAPGRHPEPSWLD